MQTDQFDSLNTVFTGYVNNITTCHCQRNLSFKGNDIPTIDNAHVKLVNMSVSANISAVDINVLTI